MVPHRLWISHSLNGGSVLITFKSKAAADLVMYKEHAQRILDVFGKDINRGVITAAESGPAVTKLEAEIAESRLHPPTEDVKRDVNAHHNNNGDDVAHEAAEQVSFSTRAYPFLEMLRAAHGSAQDILWGV
jgi:hypothetical protein